MRHEKSATCIDNEKRVAAEAAVAEIAAGMIVGLGTGSTATFAIHAVAERLANGLKIDAVATSCRTEDVARAFGIRMIDFADVARVDLAIDGVDEIDASLRAIKGGGGAMLREKIVATSADRMIAIADESKFVAQLGARPVPIEFLPFARAFVERHVEGLGGAAVLRQDRLGRSFATDQGNPVLDCDFGPIMDPEALSIALSGCPGVLGHGLFMTEVDALYLGTQAGLVRRERKA